MVSEEAEKEVVEVFSEAVAGEERILPVHRGTAFVLNAERSLFIHPVFPVINQNVPGVVHQ